MFPFYKNTGSALIIALLILGIAASIATLMQIQTHAQILLVKKLIHSDEINLGAQYAESWAVSYLYTTADQSTVNYRTRLPELNKSHMHLSGALYDMQALFNLNNLSQENQEKNLIRLIQFLSPTMETQHCESIIKEIKTLYTEFPISISAQTLLVHKSELRLISHIPPALYDALAPYLIALPQPTKINVNTAPLAVLMSFEFLKKEQAEDILNAREKNPFNTQTEVEKFLTEHNIPIPFEQITIKSNYFLLETRIDKNQEKFTRFTLLKREMSTAENDKNQVSVKKLWQSEGAEE